MSAIKQHLERIQWCIERHRETNHFYDTYLPYEFHLRMVVQVFRDFKHLVPFDHDTIEIACWGHDLIEDTRTSFNDCRLELGERASDIIYALTNEKGKNRKERGNDKYYEGIRSEPGASFVKLCDRIANVQYSKLTKSRMFEMYQKENDDFIEKLQVPDTYQPMIDYLKSLFK